MYDSQYRKSSRTPHPHLDHKQIHHHDLFISGKLLKRWLYGLKYKGGMNFSVVEYGIWYWVVGNGHRESSMECANTITQNWNEDVYLCKFMVRGKQTHPFMDGL